MESRRISRVLLGLCLPMIWIGGCNQTHPATQPVAVNAPVEPAEIPTPFDQRVDSINFEQIPLAEAVQTLRQMTGQNIFVNWRALEEAGVKRDTPVTARLRDVKLGPALRSILADAGGGHVELGTTIDDGVITISTADNLREDVMTRVYDIRDLLVVVPDFEKGPDDHVTATTQPTRAQLVEQLTSLLQEIVDAGHWKQNSKNTSNQMREVSGQLILTATPQTQKEISALLDQLRETRAVQITLEMRFVSVDLQQLPKPLAALLRQTFEQNKWSEAKSAYLTDEQTNELIRQEQKLQDSSLLTAPRITLFNGQRAYVEVGTGRAYVAGFTLVKPQNGERRFEPYVQTVSSGVIINASATASADRKFITVTVNPTLRRLMEIKSAPYKDAPADAKDLTVQVPKTSSQTLNATMSIPDRGTVVIGGLVDPGPGIDGKPTGAGKPIFLLVKPSLIVQREVASR